MTDWTSISRTSPNVSPDINDVSDVINTDTTEVIDTWRPIESWEERIEPSTEWSTGYGLWVEGYYPWKEDSLPWLRGEATTTNWTKRTAI